MSNKKTYLSTVCGCFPALILLLASAMTASALRDPAAVYCNALGYGYSIKETSKGQVGVCKPTASVECDEWDFLRGKCGLDYSFCAKSGYQQKAAKGLECRGGDPYAECLLCVMPEGWEVEVTELMRLSFEDDPGSIAVSSSMPATASTVPATMPEEPVRGKEGAGLSSYLGVSAAILLAGAALFIIWRRKK